MRMRIERLIGLPIALFVVLGAVLLSGGCGSPPPTAADQSRSLIVGDGPSAIAGLVVDAQDTAIAVPDTYVYIPVRGRGLSARSAPPAATRQGLQAAAISAADGSYRLEGIPAGLQAIVVEPPTFSHFGYAYVPMEIDVSVPEGGTLDLRLAIAVHELLDRIDAIHVRPVGGLLAPDMLLGGKVQFEAVGLDMDERDSNLRPTEIPVVPVWTLFPNVYIGDPLDFTADLGSIDEDGWYTAGAEERQVLVEAWVGDKMGWTAVAITSDASPP